VLVVLSVTILARLLGQLGAAVTSRMRAHERDLRRLVHRALALAIALIPAHGASGAAAASTVGYAAGAALAWLFFARLKAAR